MGKRLTRAVIAGCCLAAAGIGTCLAVLFTGQAEQNSRIIHLDLHVIQMDHRVCQLEAGEHHTTPAC